VVASPPRRPEIPRELGDPAFRKRLVAEAVRISNEREAEDLLADAIAEACEPGSALVEANDLSLFGRLVRVMRSRFIDKLRSRTRRSEVVDSEIVYADDRLHGAPHPERRLEAADRFQRLGGALREALVARGDDEAVAVFDARCEGTDKPSEIAEALGSTVPKVKNANARIREVARAIKTAEERAAARGVLAERPREPVS